MLDNVLPKLNIWTIFLLVMLILPKNEGIPIDRNEGDGSNLQIRAAVSDDASFIKELLSKEHNEEIMSSIRKKRETSASSSDESTSTFDKYFFVYLTPLLSATIPINIPMSIYFFFFHNAAKVVETPAVDLDLDFSMTESDHPNPTMLPPDIKPTERFYFPDDPIFNKPESQIPVVPPKPTVKTSTTPKAINSMDDIEDYDDDDDTLTGISFKIPKTERPPVRPPPPLQHIV